MSEVPLYGAYKTVMARHFHKLLLMEDDTLFAWGSNYYGQLGTGSWATECIERESDR